VATRFPCTGGGQRGAGVAALSRLVAAACRPEVEDKGGVGQLGLMGHIAWAGWVNKKAEALLGRRGMGRGKEAGCIADWAESDFGLPRENENVFEIFWLQS
jgi:hypothetical protein